MRKPSSRPISRSGRFARGPSAEVRDYSESVSFDRRLWSQDIAGSVAHAMMLGRTGLLTRAETRRILRGLEGVRLHARRVLAG